MNKEFVPYEEALALKELGFDEPCLGWYASDGSLIKDYVTNKFNEFTVAPLFQQAFRWFREKYNIKSYILPQLINEVERYTFKLVNNKVELKFLVYDTYEEAELVCLKKLIQIVKEKTA